MKWSKLLNIESGHQIIAAPRVLGNWHSKRLQIESTGRLVAIHRISAKRILFEVASVEERSSLKRPLRLGFFALIVVLFAIAAFALVGKVNIQAQLSAPSIVAEKPGCLPLRLSAVRVDDLVRFETDSWVVSTSTPILQLGAVRQVNFSATCMQNRITGLLQVFERSGKWTILKMTPTQ